MVMQRASGAARGWQGQARAAARSASACRSAGTRRWAAPRSAQCSLPCHRRGHPWRCQAAEATGEPSRGCGAGCHWPAVRSAGFMCSPRECGAPADQPGRKPGSSADLSTLLTGVVASSTVRRGRRAHAASRSERGCRGTPATRPGASSRDPIARSASWCSDLRVPAIG